MLCWTPLGIVLGGSWTALVVVVMVVAVRVRVGVGMGVGVVRV